MSFEEKCNEIEREYRAIDVDALIRGSATELSCLDPECHHHGNPPGSEEERAAGSILIVYMSGRLDEFFAARGGEYVTINVHLGCVAAYINGFRTLDDQRELWSAVERECRHYAAQFGCTLYFPDPYMGGGALGVITGQEEPD